MVIQSTANCTSGYEYHQSMICDFVFEYFYPVNNERFVVVKSKKKKNIRLSKTIR